MVGEMIFSEPCLRFVEGFEIDEVEEAGLGAESGDFGDEFEDGEGEMLDDVFVDSTNVLTPTEFCELLVLLMVLIGLN